MNPSTFAPKRILVCQLRQIGDVLLTTPALRLVHERYPEARIDVFTEKKCLPVLDNNPHIGRVWTVDKSASIWSDLVMYRRIFQTGYDLVVDFQQLPRCRMAVLASRARVRLSYPPPWYNRLFYTHAQAPQPGYSGMFRASILTPLGIVWQGEAPEIFLTTAETNWADAYLARHDLQPGGFITLDPTHRRETRLWPARHYGSMIAQVQAVRPDLRFLILYGPGEKDMATAVLDHCPAPLACVLPEEILTLRQMAAVQHLAAVHVGNCSAPRHFAVAVGTPTLTVLGATSSGWRYPSKAHVDVSLDLPCQPCNQNHCARKDRACLENLPPERVSARLRAMLGDD